jgi:hypothetical protein
MLKIELKSNTALITKSPLLNKNIGRLSFENIQTKLAQFQNPTGNLSNRDKIDNTYIHVHSLCWLGLGTSIKSGEVKPVNSPLS